MLLLLMGQLLSNHTLPPTKQIVTVLACFVVAIAIHEFMHAFVALRLGDTTAERQGRVTLNPVSHFEPFGFMGMVLISLGYNFIGWGKPVPVNPSALRVLPPDQRHRGMALVALAGPLTNVFLAALAISFQSLPGGVTPLRRGAPRPERVPARTNGSSRRRATRWTGRAASAGHSA